MQASKVSSEQIGAENKEAALSFIPDKDAYILKDGLDIPPLKPEIADKFWKYLNAPHLTR